MTKIKTPQEISEWLSKQKWARKFVRNMRAGGMTKQTARDILGGHYRAMTISSGFLWSNSPEGSEYWHRIHKNFIDWYNGKRG